MILPGCQTSHSARSSKFHHLALVVAIVSPSSNFSPLALACLAYGASVASVTLKILFLSSYSKDHWSIRKIVVSFYETHDIFINRHV